MPAKTPDQKAGAIVRTLREQAGLTLEALAAKIKCRELNRQNLWQYENGTRRMPPEVLAELREIFKAKNLGNEWLGCWIKEPKNGKE